MAYPDNTLSHIQVSGKTFRVLLAVCNVPLPAESVDSPPDPVPPVAGPNILLPELEPVPVPTPELIGTEEE